MVPCQGSRKSSHIRRAAYVSEEHDGPWERTFSIQPPSPILVHACNAFATVRKTSRTFVSLALVDDEALLSIESSAARSSASKKVLLLIRSAQKPLRRRARSMTGTKSLSDYGVGDCGRELGTWKTLRCWPPIEDLNDCFDVRT